MAKKVFTILVILVGVVGIYFWQKTEKLSEGLPEELPEEGAELPNPASVYCQEQGGTVEIRTLFDDSQKGFCLFDDHSECEEWAFFRAECQKRVSFCKDLCGDGVCQEIVCMAVGCPCPETPENCPQDCK